MTNSITENEHYQNTVNTLNTQHCGWGQSAERLAVCRLSQLHRERGADPIMSRRDLSVHLVSGSNPPMDLGQEEAA